MENDNKNQNVFDDMNVTSETEMERMARLLEEQKRAGTQTTREKDIPIVRNNEEKEVDTQSGGLCFLSLLIPLVGIIYYFVNKKKMPKRASACLKFSIIGIVVSIALSLVISLGTKKHRTVSSEKNNVYVTQVTEVKDKDKEEEDLEDEEETTATTETTTSVEKFVSSKTEQYNDFILFGDTVSLPCSFEKFKNQTGFEFMYNSDATQKLEGASETWVTGTINGQSVKVLFYNSSLSNKSKSKCDVVGISSSVSIISVPVLDNTTYIGIGHNFDYILNAMPTPEFKSNHFAVYTDRDYNELKITAENGVVTNIEIIANQK